VVADKAQTHCPRLERLVPKVLKNRKCLDTYELLNMSWLTHTTMAIVIQGRVILTDTLAYSWRELIVLDGLVCPLLRPPLRPLLFVRHARERAQALTV